MIYYLNGQKFKVIARFFKGNGEYKNQVIYMMTLTFVMVIKVVGFKIVMSVHLVYKFH